MKIGDYMEKLKYERVCGKKDCKKLQKQLKKAGYDVSLADIYLAWKHYSSNLDASWIVVKDDPKENLEHILPFLE